MGVEGEGEEMRGIESTFVRLFSPAPLLFINFTLLIHRLLHRKTFKLSPIPPPTHTHTHPPSPVSSFLLPIPLFLLASILSVSSLTPATCDFLCTVPFSLSFSPAFPFHQWFDATLVDSFLNPAAHPEPLSHPCLHALHPVFFLIPLIKVKLVNIEHQLVFNEIRGWCFGAITVLPSPTVLLWTLLRAVLMYVLHIHVGLEQW